MHQFRPARISASLPVELYTAPFYPPLRMQMQNISTGGMFIRTSLEFQVGEILMCKTWLPNMQQPCVFISRVARSYVPGVDTLDEYSGLGLQFLHGNETQRKKLVEFVRNTEHLESPRKTHRKRALPVFGKMTGARLKAMSSITSR